jgi:putative endonuclease
VRASRATGRRTSAQAVGLDAEERAARFLAERGLEIVARNFRTRLGEIDLVARDGDVLVFVEVRHRTRDDFGDGAESVTEGKQRRIEAAARLFLQQLEREPPCRFDVMSLDGDHAEWMKAAFDASPG